MMKFEIWKYCIKAGVDPAEVQRYSKMARKYKRGK